MRIPHAVQGALGIVDLPIDEIGNGPSSNRGASFTFTQNKFDGKGMSMNMLASISSQFLSQPAVNQTGLNGFYDFHFDLAPEDFSAMMSTAASKRLTGISPELLAQLAALSPVTYFDALEKVGLKMQKGKIMLEVVDIADAKQTPTEN